MFIAFFFSLLFSGQLYSNNDLYPIFPFPEEPEKYHYNNQHAEDIYRQFGIGPQNNKRNWFNLADGDRALFERQYECALWNRQGFLLAITRLCCVPTQRPIDHIDYDYFAQTESRYYYIHIDYQKFLLNQINLYEYEAFRDTVSKFCGYENKVQELHKLIHSNKDVEKRVTKRAHNAIAKVCNQIEERRLLDEKKKQEVKEEQARKEREETARKQIEKNRQEARDNFNGDLSHLANEAQSWNDLSDIAHENGLSNDHLQKRILALENIQNVGAECKQQHYALSGPSIGLIGEAKYNPNDFTSHYGNQLQHVVHQECIDILDRAARLSSNDTWYEYRKDFLDCVDASREFNQVGLTYKAASINDFCFVILDVGQAMAHGACLGVYYAAYDLATHPLQTGLCVVAGQYVLAYQACKIAYAVADVAITSYYDRDAGYEKLESYLAPVDALLTQFETGSLEEKVQNCTAVVVCWSAQNKALKGLNSIYSKARVKAVEFIKKYPQAEPELFLATPEGLLLKCVKSKKDIGGAGISPQTSIFQFQKSKLQHMFHWHAKDFGFLKTWNNLTALEFQEIVLKHIKKARVIEGTYRGKQKVLHYFDAATSLNVMLEPTGELVGGWKLSTDQIKYLLTTGAVK